MFFKKKESDAIYRESKEKCISQYEQLMKGNPFDNPANKRDQWKNMYAEIKNMYKLAKKYVDTTDDVERFKEMMDYADRQFRQYQYEAEALEYKKTIENLYYQFDNLNDQTFETFQGYQNWKRMYESITPVYKQQSKFDSNDYDEKKLEEMNRKTCFWYGLYLVEMSIPENKTIQRADSKKQFANLCLQITSPYKSVFIFSLLRSEACWQLGELWMVVDAPYLDKTQRINNLVSERDCAYSYGLNRLEKYDNKTELLEIGLNPIEWSVFKSAFWNLFSYLVYTKKSDGRAHDFAQHIVELMDESYFTDEKFIASIHGELSLFTQGLFGGWKYNGR